jgi:prevent-host-death family protein
MDAFTVRDLRERTGELIRDAEAGKLSVVTKHGKPVFVAVPLDDQLLEEGLRVALAVKLFEEEVLSLAKAARFAEMPIEAFLEHLHKGGVAVVRYPAQELDAELARMRSRR